MKKMIREEIKKLTEKAIKDLYKEEAKIEIKKTQDDSFGQYSTNAAMILKKNPQEIAGKIKSPLLEKIEVKKGFINFFLSKEYLQKQVEEILKQKESFGNLRIGNGQKVNVEFISANPTGPLTLGNGRGGFCGDVLANILHKAGYKVEREYYINDVGEQIKKLGHSVLGDAEAVYKGPYIEELRKKIKKNGENVGEVGKKAAEAILEEMIKPSVKKMGIKFDTWFYESELYKKKEIDKILDELNKNKLSYKKEGALWFRSTEFGDDRDRVLIKADGEKTYLSSDIAYLQNKIKRGFKKLIYFLGADHYGYVARIKGGAMALGYGKEQIDMIIMQLVGLIQGGKEVKMSKRTGIYLTIDELIDEVGLDVARLFFLTRSPNTHLNFDLDLAKEQSEKNPVFYIQYAYARICSIIAKIPNFKIQNPNLKLLNHPSELNLIKQLIRLPEIIEDTARDYQVQRLPQYATDLATSFHQFYRDCRVLRSSDEIGAEKDKVNEELSHTRLSLLLATKVVLKNTLDLMGITVREKM